MVLLNAAFRHAAHIEVVRDHDAAACAAAVTPKQYGATHWKNAVYTEYTEYIAVQPHKCNKMGELFCGYCTTTSVQRSS